MDLEEKEWVINLKITDIPEWKKKETDQTINYVTEENIPELSKYFIL